MASSKEDEREISRYQVADGFLKAYYTLKNGQEYVFKDVCQTIIKKHNILSGVSK